MTDPNNPRRILLVEDSPGVYTTLKRRLCEEGYDVSLATSYDTAKQLLDTERFHMSIFDLRLVDSDEENQDGMRLLEYAKQLGLVEVMPCVMLTAYADLASVLKATQDLHAAGFVTKDPGYVSKLLGIVGELFDDTIKINFGIGYDPKSRKLIEKCAGYIHQAEEKPAQSLELLTLQVYDLLGKLFTDAEKLSVSHLIQGYSGSAVLYITPQWRDGVGHPLVVKISRQDKTERERKNYDEYVAHYMPANHATTLGAHHTQHLGAIAYTMANTDITRTVNFEKFFADHSAREINSALRHLFRHTCELWYKRSRRQPRLLNLRDLYYRAFDLAPDRLAKEIMRLRPEVTLITPTIRFVEPNIELPNPLLWLEEEGASMMPLTTTITHGDLNARNILINNQGECWLIDFYRTYRSHILRDFVELETDIKFRLLPVVPMERFCAFERKLVEMSQPTMNFDLGGEAMPEEKKAAQVIAGLRAEAWELLNWPPGAQSARETQREYLSSLLVATMNIIRLRHFKDEATLNPQRERALLSAGLIYQEIKRVNTMGSRD